MSDRWIQVCMEGMELDDDAAAQLEVALQKEPADVELRVKHLGCLVRREQPRGTQLLWLTEHHPEVDVGGFGHLLRDDEPEAYDAIRAAWEVHLAASPDAPMVLKLAAKFMGGEEPLYAEALLRRAALAEPNEPDWPSRLADSAMRRSAAENDESQRLTLATLALEYYEQALVLESDEFLAHVRLCDVANAAAAAQHHDRGRQAAHGVLRSAAKYERTWQFGNSIHWANIALGHIAMDEGDTQAAEQKLLAAGGTRGSPQLNSFGPDQRLARRLLAAGSRQVVTLYLRECRRFWQCDNGALSRWLEQLAAGEPTMLEEYEYDEEDSSR